MQHLTRALSFFALVGLACGEPESTAGPDEQLLEYADAGIPERTDAGPEPEIEVCFDIGTLPDAQLPRCTAATRDCVAACPADQPGEECRNGCWGSDPTPPAGDIGCDDCVFRQLIGCIDTADNGICHAPVAAFVCCLVGGSGACDAESNEMFTCGYVSEPACFDLTGGVIGRCYAETDPTEETPDGGT